MDVIANGLLFGLILSVSIGPVFFALIQNAIENGFFAGFLMAVGIAVSDAAFISILFFGLAAYADNSSFQMVLGGVGGLIMLAFGIGSLIKPAPHSASSLEVRQRHTKKKHIVKGFLLNGINPFVLIFWLGIVSLAKVKYQYSGQEAFWFFFLIVATVFFFDLIKSYLAMRLKRLITPRLMKILNRIVGLLLIVFALRLFYFAFDLF
ncbi:MAG: LysE family translocator [Cyclobacteriaceae bacterium]|nr:LysE family transporter [Cyclobacteriaceae bacterium]MCH8516692.1 LysE family translocator [Cyclobacteriaceae bacterium]